MIEHTPLIGAIYRSKIGNTWRVLARTENGCYQVQRLLRNGPEEHTDFWSLDDFAGMTRVKTVPCPACKRDYDPTMIPAPRVPLTIRCACCCQ